MCKINIIIFSVLVCSRFINGQVENLIGIPAEYNFPETHDSWESDLYDIWSEDNAVKTEVDSPVKLLATLCEKYDFELNNQILDCENVRIVPKHLKLSEHNIKRRDASDDNLEGSGDDTTVAETENSSLVREPLGLKPIELVSAKPKDEDQPKEPPLLMEPPNLPKLKDLPDEPKQPEVKVPDAPAVPNPTTEESKTNEKTVEPEGQDKPVPTSTKAVETKQSSTKTGDSPFKKQSLGEGAETGKAKEADETKQSVEETPLKETAQTETQAHKEEINTHQSGNAILEGETIFETDKNIKTMKSNESIKSNATQAEEPKSGASEETGKSRNDNKLLIIILGVIMVIGVAAFAYNYIQKRKNRNALVSAEVQNGQPRTDPEEGREMKPLINSPGQNAGVEFKDEK